MSCQNIDSPLEPSNALKTESKFNYAITEEMALANLYGFLGTTNTSRGEYDRKVESIIPIKYHYHASRSIGDTIICDNLMYIANFEKGSGYAILAGDIRIPDRVIALIDEGALSESIVNSAIDILDNGKAIFEDYPVTGPGFFTDSRYGDELFMNPNTVTFENLEIQDTLVGNYSMDDIGAENEYGILLNSDEKNNQFIELYTSYMCAAYAIHALKFEMDKGLATHTPIGGFFEGAGENVEHTITKHSDWTVTKQTSKILSLYSLWNQDSPFNDFYPKRRKWVILGHQRKAPAGCFPLAIAKVLTHFEYPNEISYNGHIVNWKSLKINRYSAFGNEESAAALLRTISLGCDCLYFYNGTWTYPSKASSFMKDLGFSNVKRYNYNFDRVTSMLDANKPLIIYAIPGINIFSSHAWNIDGYRIKERTITTETHKNAELINSSTKTESINMVHCDFGWSGMCNGYYVSGVFKLNDPNSEKDDPNDTGENKKYNHHVRIITYDK